LDVNKEILKILNSKRAEITPEGRVRVTAKFTIEELFSKGRKIGIDAQGSYYLFNQLKPIFLFSDRDSESKLDIAEEALEEVLNYANLDRIIPIRNVGYWNQGQGEHESAEWYLKQSFDQSRRQHDIKKLFKELRQDPIQTNLPHYDVFIISEPLYDSDERVNFVIGEGDFRIRRGAIISLCYYEHESREIIKQAFLHEFGHACLGNDHCGKVSDNPKNLCTMKYPDVIPPHLKMQADYRLKTGQLFCGEHNYERENPWMTTFGKSYGWSHLQLFSELNPLIYKIKEDHSGLIKQIIDTGKLAQLETKVELI
jgi:hypothetical protein